MWPLKVSRSATAAARRGSVNVDPHSTERCVGGDGDAGAFVAFGEDLEQQLGAARVQVQVAELVELCGHPHSSTYADTATMPRFSVVGCRSGDDAGLPRPAGTARVGIVLG